MGKEVNKDNLYVGKGKVYFDRFDDNGASTGERFVGDVSVFEVTPSDQRIQHYGSATAAAALMADVLQRREYTLRMVAHEHVAENIALVAMGTVSALAQGSGSVTDEVVTVVDTDRFYKLAFRNVSTVVVMDDTDTTTYVAGTDYDVDAATGRLYIIAGGAIVATDVLHVDYAYAADTSPIIQGGVDAEIEGFVRFIGDPSVGPTWDVEVWKVSVNPAATLALISEQFGSIELQLKVLDDSTNHPTEPFFRAIRRVA